MEEPIGEAGAAGPGEKLREEPIGEELKDEPIGEAGATGPGEKLRAESSG